MYNITLSTAQSHASVGRDKRSHARNRHLRSHRGFSVALTNGFAVGFPNGLSLVSCIVQRIVTFPVDFNLNCPMDFSGIFQWISCV